jgi:serine/threonine protein phosphatase PrpC
MGFQCVTRTHVGCRRKVNEDAVLSRPDLGLWAVADGMGGHEAGEVASALVVDGLAACEPGMDSNALSATAQRTLKQVNAELVAMAGSGPRPRTIGSTVVAIAADGASFACLWAGDSRAYLARDGVLIQLTRDHSLVQHLVDIGEIDASEAGSHPNANVIMRAVGAAAELQIDTVEGEITPGDAFLLASDGLTRLMSDGELLASLQAVDFEASADHLIQSCLARGAPDNVSFVMLRALS